MAHYHAREAGKLGRSQLLHARPPVPPQHQRRAAWAAVALRIEQGATPTLADWQSLKVVTAKAASTSAIVWSVLGVSAALAVGVGAVALAPAEEKPAPKRHAVASREVSTTALEAPLPNSPRPLAARPQSNSRPRVERLAPARAPRDRVVELAPRNAPDPLAEETRLLEVARSALQAKDHARALKALDQHAQSYPDGVLADERRSTWLRALCGRGDKARARVLATRRGARWVRVLKAQCG